MKPPSGTKRGNSGQALLLVIVGMSLFLLGTLGLAIDGAQLYAQRQMAQTAADAAAQAAVMNLFDGTNLTSPNPFAAETPPIPITCTPTNMTTPCVYARLNGFGLTSGAGSDTVTITFPTAITGVTTLSSSAAVPAIAVSVQRDVKNTLIRMIGGPATTTIRARATAAMVGGVPPDCIYALDPGKALNPGPSPGSLDISGSGKVVSGCGIQVKSTNNPNGGTISGGGSVTAPSLNGYFNIPAWIHPVNAQGQAVVPSQTPSTVPDPYISILPPPVASSCDAAHTNYVGGHGTWSLNPGTFCGGINITSDGTATFSPGIYVIKGGDLQLDGNSTETGNGVMFYLTGANGSVNIGASAHVTLTAPSSGPYTGLLFFQDKNVTTAGAIFSGAVAMKLSGGLYFPKTTIAFNGSSNCVNCPIAIVAYRVSFTGGVSVSYDPTGQLTGLGARAIALAE